MKVFSLGAKFPLRKGGARGLFFLFSVALLLCCSVALSSAFKLPDTGQTKCYQSVDPYAEIPCAGTEQDGAYNINPMSFTGNGSTVTDNNTGLTWQTEDDGTTRTWDQAVSYCATLSLSGTGWRLPSKKELITIVDYSIPYPGPTINPIFTNTKQSNYWSSTAPADDPLYAWYVVFNYGFVHYFNVEVSVSYVRCVRGGQ